MLGNDLRASTIVVEALFPNNRQIDAINYAFIIKSKALFISSASLVG